MSTKTLEPVTTAPTPTNGQTAKRRILKKADILASKPREFEDVPTDEWEEGSAVRVIPMDFATRDLWDITRMALADDKTGDALKGVRLTIVARHIVDEHGNRQFTEADLAALGEKDARPIQRAFNAIQKLSKNDLDAEIEHAVKNSDSAPSEGRSTS